MSGKTGRYAIIEQFLADGITHMFGNPGTVEQGFLDALEAYPHFEYVVTLQETIAVAMADAYARSRKKPALVQLHSGVGLGNGIGMMYQAYRGHAPLVVIAGESGVQYDAMDAQMAADLVAMAKPVTKWATRVVHPSSLLRVLRRAIKIASTAPMGPVFVSLPMDVLDAIIEEPIEKTSVPETRSAPPADLVAQAAAMLAGASRPMIIMGDGIAYSGAQDELRVVAEALGAEVWGADSSEVNISFTHPLYMGALGHMFGTHSAPITSQADAVLICGTYVFPEVFPAMNGVWAPGAKIVHIDLNAYEIAKNHRVDLGLVADPKLSLGALVPAVRAAQSDAQKDDARARIIALEKRKHDALGAAIAHDDAVAEQMPMDISVFMKQLAHVLPDDAVIFDEALTSGPALERYLHPHVPGQYFQTRGGSLGVGIPGALGLKLAHPDKTVIGFTGDGGSMYTIQALWTAVRHNIGAKFVICNNHTYMLLKLNIMEYWKERGIEEHRFPDCFDIGSPVVDFAGLARSMGVPARTVDRPADVAAAIEEMLATDGPYLLDVVVSNRVPGSKA
ncbi:MAG: thiamine pyrophosphate-binding protein [Ignavibacteria bacterium]|nr:thiamine pyrophosphate-binding protein [Ignavibacteria bacterium]